jgi:hypothetical protein
MKVLLRFVLIFIGAFILVELNSNNLISDIKGLFHKNAVSFFSSSYSSRYTDTIPNDYLQILHLDTNCCKSSDTSELYIQHMTMNTLIGPIATFVYKKQYYLQVRTLSDSFNLSLNNLINQYNISPKHLYGYIESENESAINYSHRLSQQQNIKTIYLKLLGKSNRLILKNDSIAYYCSLFTKFSIQYNDPNAFTEIYAETKGGNLFHTEFLPLEILFLKRDNKLYLLTMSVLNDNQNTKYSPGMLYNLIKPNNANNN